MSIIRITKKDKETKARLGILTLPHGEVETPAFMPVGTNGTVKGIYHDTIRKIGYRLILANTYHLYLRPGTEVLEDFNGLHNFSAWDGNILTDSGGFQVFSLSGLRKESALTISDMDFPGIAIGGLSVGEEKNVFEDMLAYTAEYVTEEKPRYVMGIGSPDYILAAVENGIDLFDCVLATRMARNGGLFTDDGVIALKKAQFRFDHGPVQEGCGCTLCREYSRAYMHHLIKCNEMLGGMLATEHNLQYLYDLMIRIRKAIAEDRFAEFKRDYLKRFYASKS